MIFGYATVHPELIHPSFGVGLLHKAMTKKLIRYQALALREFSEDKHRRIDDAPYGGGAGMILSCDPIVKALQHFENQFGRSKRILLSAKGRPVTQLDCENWSKEESLFFICGRYEGVDERVALHFADIEVRTGDFVMMGGDVAALAITEAVARLIPGVVGNEESILDESFSDAQKLEHPQYTRPASYQGFEVPEVLLSGDHQKLLKWKEQNAKRSG